MYGKIRKKVSGKCSPGGTTVSIHNNDDDEYDYEEDDINPRHERLSLGPKIYGPLRTSLRAGTEEPASSSNGRSRTMKSSFIHMCYGEALDTVLFSIFFGGTHTGIDK